MRALRIVTAIAIVEMMELRDRRDGGRDMIMITTTTMDPGTIIPMIMGRGREGEERGVPMHTRRFRSRKLVGRNSDECLRLESGANSHVRLGAANKRVGFCNSCTWLEWVGISRARRTTGGWTVLTPKALGIWGTYSWVYIQT
jgi:hypothetical protein